MAAVLLLSHGELVLARGKQNRVIKTRELRLLLVSTASQ